MANKYYDSLGVAYTQAEINRKRSEAYLKKYDGKPHPTCEETGVPAQCSSHIISQSRCKELRIVELIWNPENFFPATHEVNSRWEANDKTLRNYNKYMQVVKKFDPETYHKRTLA
jgi:hypothetical protein